MLDKTELKKIIQNVPLLPMSVTTIINELNKEKIELKKLEKIIAKDPFLTGRLLASANSPFYGFSGQVNSLNEACMVLGVHSIRNIVLTAGIVENLPAERLCHFNSEEFWHHSLGTAISASVIAKKTNHDSEAAFTAGLLHDIGKLILDIHFNEMFGQVIEYRDKHNCLLIEAEQHVLGVTHADIGALVSLRWKLPKIIINVINQYHKPSDGEEDVIVDIVHVASIISRCLEIGDPGDSVTPMLNEKSLKRLNFTINNLGDAFHDIEILYEKSLSLIST